MINHQLITLAADHLYHANYAIALTGAGLSTPSGIPDFRSDTSGLWTQADPMEVASFSGFRYNPLGFYRWIKPLVDTILSAEPNAAHYALTNLEEMGILKSIITQNIDMLHSRSGSKTLYEVHGHTRLMTCITCFEEVEAEPFMKILVAQENAEVPRCPTCGGVLKPNVILFGEQLPMPILIKAEQAVRHADVLLVAGSSLEVFPVADFPQRVKMHGGKVIIVNRDQTAFDSAADIVIHDDVAVVLPALVNAVRVKKNS